MQKKKKNSLKKENLIHIKLDYIEAKKGKTNLLSSELNLLRSLTHLSNYKNLRIQELNMKKQIFQKIKEIKSNLGKLQTKLPKLKIPKILQKDSSKIKEEVKEYVSPIKKGNIESQLIEIQEKLRILEG